MSICRCCCRLLLLSLAVVAVAFCGCCRLLVLITARGDDITNGYDSVPWYVEVGSVRHLFKIYVSTRDTEPNTLCPGRCLTNTRMYWKLLNQPTEPNTLCAGSCCWLNYESKNAAFISRLICCCWRMRARRRKIMRFWLRLLRTLMLFSLSVFGALVVLCITTTMFSVCDSRSRVHARVTCATSRTIDWRYFCNK